MWMLKNTMIYGVCIPANNAGALGLENLRSAFARMHRQQPSTVCPRAQTHKRQWTVSTRKGTLLLFLRCRRRRCRRRRRATFAATCVSRKRRRRQRRWRWRRWRSENIGDVISNWPRFSEDPWEVPSGEFMSQLEPRGTLMILRNCQTIDIPRFLKLNFTILMKLLLISIGRDLP